MKCLRLDCDRGDGIVKSPFAWVSQAFLWDGETSVGDEDIEPGVLCAALVFGCRKPAFVVRDIGLNHVVFRLQTDASMVVDGCEIFLRPSSG